MASNKISRRELRQSSNRRRQLMSRLVWGVAALLVLAVISYGTWRAFRPKLGVSIPVMATKHIDDGEQHDPYNSNPPTSGPHYAQPASAGFYDEALPDEQLVHNLEHGYVVIWYNCTGLDETACTGLKTQIREVMNRASLTKLIAVPRLSLSGPIAATTWGRLYQPAALNADQLLEFIKEFRYKAPEPGAP